MSDNKAIVEGNKLIAEFMGFKMDKDWILIDDSYDGKYHVSVLDYHTNWKILMPVVEKICKIKCIWDNVEPHELDTYYPRTFGMLNEKTKRPMVRLNSCPLFEADTLIEAMWLAIVDFIKFYNQNKTS